MKLYLNKTSPYARLVMVVAHEKGLADSVQCMWTDPWSSPPELRGVTPLTKVPVLITDEGESIVESACICDYLDAKGTTRRLLPESLPKRLPVLRKHGLGRGLIDVAFGVTIDRRFAPPNYESELARRWLDAISATITTIERDASLQLADTLPDLGDLAIAVGLSYSEFRISEVKWRASSPRLSHWLDRLTARSSFQHTKPD